MSFYISTHPQVEEDIRQAMQWIAEYSPQKSALQYFEILQAIDSLRNFPARCAFAPERKIFGLDIRQLLFDKYQILFVIDDSGSMGTHQKNLAANIDKFADSIIKTKYLPSFYQELLNLLLYSNNSVY